MPSLSLSSPPVPLPAPGAPVLSADSDSNIIGDGFTNKHAVRLEGKGTPNTWIKVFIGPNPADMICYAQTDAEGHWTNISEDLPFGSYAITAREELKDGGLSAPSEALLLTIRPEPDPMAAPRLDRDSDTGVGQDGITLMRQPTLSGKGEAQAEIKLYLDGGAQAFATVTATDDGSWSYRFPSELKDGLYRITATQTAHGFTSLPSGEFELRIDNQPPAAPTILRLDPEDDTGATGDNKTGEDRPTLEGKGGKEGCYINLYDSATDTLIGDGRIKSDGSWAARLDKLSDGTYTIYAKEESVAGVLSAASAPITITVDLTPDAAPTGLALARESDSGKPGDGITDVSEPVITGRGAPGAELTVFFGKSNKHADYVRVDEHGNWRVKLPALAPGDYEFEAVQWDDAGNESAASTPLKVSILPPPVKLMEKSDSGVKGDGVTADSRPWFEGRGQAGNQIALHLGENGLLLGTVDVSPDGQWQLGIDQLKDGKYTLVAYESKGGAQVAKQEMALTIDTAKPGKLKLSKTVVEAGAPKNSAVGKLSAEDAGSAQLSYKLAPKQGDGFSIDGDTLLIRDPQAFRSEKQTVAIEISDAAGNTTVEELTVLVKQPAPPTPTPTPRPLPEPLVDGVAVAKGTVGLPDGTLGQSLTIPVIGSQRVDSSGASATADIPLVDQGLAKLTAHLPAGLGLSATGAASQAAGQSLAHLVSVIRNAATGHTAAEQDFLASKGLHYLQQLAPDTGLQVEHLMLSGDGSQPAGALTLSGTAQAQQHTALVIDTQALKTGAAIVLQDVSFASVIGSGQVSAGTAGQILSGDQASQHFSVHSGAGGKVFAGGGNDVLQFGVAAQSGVQGAAPAATAPAATLLDGGQGQDTASFLGKQAEYQLTRHDGYVTVASLAKPHEVATLVNVEKLQFSDGVLELAPRSELGSLAALYQNVLGRQADAQGFSFWGQAQEAGISLGRIALEMIASPEARKLGFAFHGQAQQDVSTLYQAIFERAPDAGGLAFYVDAMQRGATLEQVADGLLHSLEMVGWNQAQSSWDFSF